MTWTCPKCPPTREAGTEKVKGRGHCRLCERERLHTDKAKVKQVRERPREVHARKCRWAKEISNQYLSMSLIKRED